MTLCIKSINADTSFLLTFTPPDAPSARLHPPPAGSFTILLDPWLEGTTHVYHPRFSQTSRTGSSCIASLAELDHEPDIIACSQDKPDHCNRATLTRLSPECASRFVSTPAAVKKIRSWNHFNPDSCTALAAYSSGNPDTVLRLAVPPPSSTSGAPGEVTISILAPSFDISGLHNAIGITYRPPSPATSHSLGRERTLSALYAPHGIPYPVVKAWAQTHLVREAALPLTALLHNFDEVDNPWYLGGTIAHGLRGGAEIAKNLAPRVWAGAHDEEKELSGVGIRLMRTRKVGVAEVMAAMGRAGVDVEPGEDDEVDVDGRSAGGSTGSPGKDGSVGGGGSGGSTATTDDDSMSAGARSKKMKIVVLGVGEELRVDG